MHAHSKTSHANLINYVLIAVLARTATGGAIVAIVLLATSFGDKGMLAGALAACLTAPHVCGPIYGRWLDEAKDPRILIGAASLVFTVFFQLAIVGIHYNLISLIYCSLLICGVSSSFLMGGLSTQLTYLTPNTIAEKRYAQSWDTISYGIGLTIGPLLIAVLSQLASVTIAISLLMTLPVFASLFLLKMPQRQAHSSTGEGKIAGFRQIVGYIRNSSALKSTLMMTSGASFSIAALPVMAVYLSKYWQQNDEAGAFLVTLYGVGCLCGAILLIFKPLKANALILLRKLGIFLLVCLSLVAFSQSFELGLVTYWLCGVVNSIFFAATLAARTEYAPRQGAAQIFMWVAACKISAASFGTLMAGLLVDYSIYLPFIFACSVLMIALMFLQLNVKPVIESTYE
ncbi:MFS transporter [Agaribacter flavus]|uniref:MFS transporter n=1 Tax=Agaribacter flavus TaxID=1902781 RepID=A0ABV7FLK2_9ALTE